MRNRLYEFVQKPVKYLLFAVCILYVASFLITSYLGFSAYAKASGQEPADAVAPAPAPPPVSAADLKQQLDDLQQKMAAQEKEQEREAASLRDRADSLQKLLAFLTGLGALFAAMLGISAFINVKLVQDNAKRELDSLKESVKEQLTQAKDSVTAVQNSAQTQLGTLTASIDKQVKDSHRSIAAIQSGAERQLQLLKQSIEEQVERSKDSVALLEQRLKKRIDSFEAEVRSDIPALSELGRKLSAQVASIEFRLPASQDWIEPESSFNLDPAVIQGIITDEYTLASWAIFPYEKVPEFKPRISRLYQSLGRFYSILPTFNTFPDYVKSDMQAKSEFYFQRACEVDDRNASAFKDRGVFQMKKDDTLSDKAAKDLRYSLSLNSLEPGALYNLALLTLIKAAGMVNLDAKLQGIREGYDLLTLLIDHKEKITEYERAKYLDYAYLNRACCHLLMNNPEPKRTHDMRLALHDLKSGQAEAVLACNLRREELNKWRKELTTEVKERDLQPLYARPEFASEIDRLLTTIQLASVKLS